MLPEGAWALGHSKGHGLVLADSFVACALCWQLHMDCVRISGWTVDCHLSGNVQDGLLSFEPQLLTADQRDLYHYLFK